MANSAREEALHWAFVRMELVQQALDGQLPKSEAANVLQLVATSLRKLMLYHPWGLFEFAPVVHMHKARAHPVPEDAFRRYGPPFHVLPVTKWFQDDCDDLFPEIFQLPAGWTGPTPPGHHGRKVQVVVGPLHWDDVSNFFQCMCCHCPPFDANVVYFWIPHVALWTWDHYMALMHNTPRSERPVGFDDFFNHLSKPLRRAFLQTSTPLSALSAQTNVCLHDANTARRLSF